MKPEYYEDVFSNFTLENFVNISWEQHRPTRYECFMSENPGVKYTYGKNDNAETYYSIKIIDEVLHIMQTLNNKYNSNYNGCFLNKYENHFHHLGWHADDFIGMDQDHPIASVSFGQEREIWWKENGFSGLVPAENRQLLKNGSVFIMPGGFQKTHQHRIPKGDRNMTTRISLTFRRFLS